MNESVITGLFTLFGVLVTGIVAIISQNQQIKSNERILKHKRLVNEMISNLDAFHHLEEEYIATLIAYRTQKGDTTFVTHDAILKEFRKKLREKDMDLDFSPSYITHYKKFFDC